jgi:hypothetical protein
MASALGPPMERHIDDRRAHWIYAFGRLAPGATIQQAHAALNAVYSPIVNEVEAPLQRSMRDSVMKQFRAKQLVLKDGRRGQSDWLDAKTPLFLLFAITGLVLLIACANIANLC